jgi:hypothetical protein
MKVSGMKKFAVTYIVMVFVLAVAWPLLGRIMPSGMPGDTSVLIGDLMIHLLYGTSLIFSLLIILVLWMLRKL